MKFSRISLIAIAALSFPAVSSAQAPEQPPVLDGPAVSEPAASAPVETAEQSPAEVQITSKGSVGEWEVTCETNGGCLAGQVHEIVLTDNATGQESTARILYFLTSAPDFQDAEISGPRGVLTTIVPLGVNVSQPLAIVPSDSIGASPAWRGEYRECLPTGCVATGGIDSFLFAGREGWDMRILTADGNFIAAPIDAENITGAFDLLERSAEEHFSSIE